ncbi:MAG: HDIG domain-containing protein [Spirochaetes bacterium]|jgi:hypothetical protein|nr:HDIG domain-containing protein [Spirochaetota bacterium]
MRSRYKISFQLLDIIKNSPPARLSLYSVAAIILLSTLYLSLNILGSTYDYTIGETAREDVRVPRDINYKNESETFMKMKRASEEVPLVFDKDAGILTDRLNIINQLINNVANTLEENPPLGTEDLTFQLMSLKARTPQYLQFNDRILLELLKYNNPQQLKKLLSNIMIYIYDDDDMGVLDSPYINPINLPNKNVKIRTINTQTDFDEVSRNITDMKSINDVRERVYNICYSIAPNLPQGTLSAVVDIVKNTLRPNIRFNPEESKRRIREAAKAIKPVMGSLQKGQTIVRRGDTITAEHMHNIKILNDSTRTYHIRYITGILLMQVLFFIVFGYFIIRYSRSLIPDRKSTIITFTLMAFFITYAFFISRSENIMTSKFIFVLLLPIPFVTMIVAILYNIYLALIVGMNVIFITVMLSGGEMSTIMLSFSSALLGVVVNENVDKRTDFLKGGLIVGLINSLLMIAISLIEEIPLINTFKMLHFSLGNGLINSILVLGILPLYENVFSITTKFKLLELSDLNADIFKTMLLNAPGTYHHSLIVSTMSEAACKDLNANYMLARVGAFYHDIGKINDANLFIENGVTDPRARTLSPRQYSQLIISHVQKGVEIARENDIPEQVIDFIREHHGESIMSYFYHQALETIDSNGASESIAKTDFQYPGPRPSKKETAVVMLADVIEAASRSLKNPNKAQLEGLVRRIVYNKLNEGELDYSDLSMAELNIVQQSFLKILNGLYHSRIEYPDREDVKNLEEKLAKHVV